MTNTPIHFLSPMLPRICHIRIINPSLPHSHNHLAITVFSGLAAAADADHERLYHMVVERQLVFDNLLGKFHPFIAYIVANEHGHYHDPLVRETALLALCRYMCVSNTLCEQVSHNDGHSVLLHNNPPY